MNHPTILIVLSEEQQAEYQSELDELKQPGLELLILTSPEVALDRVELFDPAAILVGMEVGPMEGLEFLALLMKRYPKLETPVVVLPSKDDPFSPVVHQRDLATGKSLTENVDFDTVREMFATIKREGGTQSEPRISLDSQPALEPVAPADDSFSVAENTPAPPVAAPDVLAPTHEPTPSKLPMIIIVLVALAAIVGGIMIFGGDDKPPKTTRRAAATPPDLSTRTAEPAAVARLDTSVVAADAAATPAATDPAAKLKKLAPLPLRFHFGKASFSATSDVNEALKPYKEALDKDATLKIEVGGHTSDEGDAALNLKIGRQRAERVLSLLLEAGIAAKRIQIKRYGVSPPVASNDTDDGKQKNRRVTLRLIPAL